MELTVIFPNQLFENSELIKSTKHIVLIEEYLFFRHYNFHKQKILFHRMSMKFYQDYLLANHKVEYVESHQPQSDVRIFIKEVGDNVKKINMDALYCNQSRPFQLDYFLDYVFPDLPCL